MPQVSITINRPEVSVSTTQTGPTVTISETPVAITQNTSEIAVTTNPQVVQINTAATTIQTTTLDEAFKGDWSADVIYHRGDLVRHEQAVYVYINTTPSTTLHPDVATDLWVLLFSESGLTAPQVEGINRAINMKTWDATTAYSIGDIVMVRQDYDIDVGVTVPYFTMYRLYHISGSINVNPFTHSSPPTTDETGLVFNQDSAWQNLSGVRSINGFSGDVNLQEILDAGSLALNATTFHQGSEGNHGSFEAHADDVYLYGNNVYIGQSTSDQMVGFLLSNAGGSGLLALDPADGKLKFSYDFITYYTLPTSTDDLTEGTTNLYYTSARANADFDTRLATKSTTDIAEGTNLYYTSARSNSDFDTRLATKDTDDLAEGIANKYYTDARFDTRLATKSTTDITEGTNLYYTDARFDTRLATKDTDDLAEGGNLYYTTARSNTDFDARLATKSTTNLAEGTNLYYTSARANADFDTRLATKSTTNLAEGTNLYHTAARARGALSGSTGITYNNTTGSIAIDDTVVATHTYVGTQIANLVDSSPSTLDTLNELAAALGDDPNFATTVTTALGNKLNTADFTTTANTWYATSDPIQNNTTDDLSEGTTNLYHTTSRVRNSISGGTGIGYNATTGEITADVVSVNGQTGAVYLDTDDISEGTTNQYYTTARARSAYTGTGNITVNATTGVISFDGPTGPDTTDELTEGTTNLYYTDARSRSAISLGNVGIQAGLTYNSSTGAFNYVAPGTDDVAEGMINQYFTADRARSAVANGVDLDVDGSNAVYVKSIRDATYVLGELQATRNTAFINPPPNTSEVSGSNGFEAVSSGPDTAGPLGYSAGFTATYYHGETDAGSQISPTFTSRASAGTNAGGGGAIPANTVMGTFNFNGHSGTGFASYVATQNGGGGKQTLNPLQLQGYATQAFAENTISLPTTATTQSNLTIGAVASSGNGVFTNTSGDIRQYDVVRVTGTLTGTMTFPGYVSGNIYYVIAGANPTTTFTLSAVHDGTPIATTAGTTTGLTFTRHRSIITFAAQTFAPFGFGSKVTVAGITPTGYNGTHRAVFGSTTQVGYGNYQTGTTQTVAGTVSIYNVTSGGTGFRVRGFPDNASYNNTNRINFINHNVAACTYRSDSFTWQGGTNSFNYMVMNAAGATFNTGNITVKDLAGTTTYATIDSTKVLAARPVRYVSTAGGNFAGGSTYTPAATVTNSISTAITSGSGGFTIALTNLLVANEGGHYQILVSNTSGSVQQVTTTGGVVNINHNLANGSSMMITVYIVNTSAFCEHIA